MVLLVYELIYIIYHSTQSPRRAVLKFASIILTSDKVSLVHNIAYPP